jgi:hypothetical protein
MTLHDAVRPLPYATMAAAVAVVIVRQPLGIEPQFPYTPAFLAATVTAVIVAMAIIIRATKPNGRNARVGEDEGDSA